MNLFGIKVVESPLCEMTVPARKHRKGRCQSEAYHRRIQKKWLKRFGTKKEKVAFMFNPAALGLPGEQSFALHPDHMAMIRNFALLEPQRGRSDD